MMTQTIGLVVLLAMKTSSTAHSTVPIMPYVVESSNTSCTDSLFQATVELNKPFQGIIYAKGFPLEKNCRALGTKDAFVNINLNTSGCGVRLTRLEDDRLMYSVILNLQTDRVLQQSSDMETVASCILSPHALEHTISENRQRRTGRKQVLDGKPTSTTKAIGKQETVESWMELGSPEIKTNKVMVGEPTMLLVKSYLPDGISANVVDCIAHDGTGYANQKLLDETGCPVDENIMSSMEVIPEETSNEIAWDQGQTSEKVLRVMGTLFPAFKFPDTSNLHIKCVLEICNISCPLIQCSNETNRSPKAVRDTEFRERVVDRIEVFNSVEVLAPGIDARSDWFSDDSNIKSTSVEKTFCLSVSKMASSFAVLGAIFLCGVLAVLWTVMRNHSRKNNSFDGSEQVLVVRDSPLNLMKPYSTWSYS